MNNHSIQRLKQSLQHFFKRYDAQKEETVYAKFSPTLFTENWQKTAFYFQQIERTCALLEKSENSDALEFYMQKLTAQCTALSDALNRDRQNAQWFPADAAESKPTDKRFHPAHSLPPRERLAKYYEYLSAFNEKIQLEQDRQNKARRDGLFLDNGKLTQLEQRRARCLEAIEMLEDYLVFMEKQK